MNIKIEDFLTDNEEIAYDSVLYASHGSEESICLYVTNYRVIWFNDSIGFKSILLKSIKEISCVINTSIFLSDKIGGGQFTVDLSIVSFGFDIEDEAKKFHDALMYEISNLSCC